MFHLVLDRYMSEIMCIGILIAPFVYSVFALVLNPTIYLSTFFCVPLSSVQQGKPVPVDTESLTMDLLETNKCYLLESGLEIYVWMGKGTSLADKKGASKAAEVCFHFYTIGI